MVSIVIAYAGCNLLLDPGDGFYFIQLADGWEETAIYPWGPMAFIVPLVLWWVFTAIRSANRWSLHCCALFVIATFGMCLLALEYRMGGVIALGAIVLACFRTGVFLMDGGFVPEEDPQPEMPGHSSPSPDSDSTEVNDA